MEKIKLINSVTPLYKLNLRSKDISIWIKRDDLLDFAFGGNKVRLFEYIATVIKEKNVRRIVTYGSQYSNYVRVAAAVCALLNIECDLIILDEDSTHAHGGNALLLDRFDVNILHCPVEKAHDFIDDHQESLKRNGIEFMWIPGGGHITEASFGYVDAADEIMQQSKMLNVHFDAVFLPCGTGTSQAGLIYGLDNEIDVFGVSVARKKEKCIEVIKDTLDEMVRIAPKDAEYGNINVIHDEKTAYGEINSNITNIMKRLANTDGIFLDPVYNARAFSGMLEILDSQETCDLKNVLYINTGGQPNLFLTGD